MSNRFRWLYIILQPYCPTAKGYVLKQSQTYFETKTACINNAKQWLNTADYDMCYQDRGPILVIKKS